MKVEQKSYAQILILDKSDFVFSSLYAQYESKCPFMCFPGICAKDFSTGLKSPKEVVADKDVILLLKSYWDRLASEEKKAILDHELGHISNGDLKKVAEKLKAGDKTNETDLDEESKADQYSVELNGKKAMHNGLEKAILLMMEPYKAKGMNISLKDVIANDPIIKKRLELLKQEQHEPVQPEQ